MRFARRNLAIGASFMVLGALAALLVMALKTGRAPISTNSVEAHVGDFYVQSVALAVPATKGPHSQAVYCDGGGTGPTTRDWATGGGFFITDADESFTVFPQKMYVLHNSSIVNVGGWFVRILNKSKRELTLTVHVRCVDSAP